MRPSRVPRRSPEKAFESLYERHFREIFGYSLALLHSPADAEDATQATFLNAYRAFERGERPRHPASWLRAIALNVCREHFRRASRRPEEVSLEEDPGELVVEPPEPAIGDVVRALSHLPFNQRAALVMREFEGRPVTEIADLLDVTSAAVETLLFRARRALREQLEGSLLCDQAERAISRQLDGALPRSERGSLRAHLRECPECAALARRLRAQRSALKSLALVPVPATLAWSKFAFSGAAGGSSSAAGASSAAAGASAVAAGAAPVAVKLAAATALAALAVGAGYAAIGHHAFRAPARGAVVVAARSAIAHASSPPSARGPRVAGNAPDSSRLEHGPGGVVLAAEDRRGDARAATPLRHEHGASGAAADASIAGSNRGGAASRSQAARGNSSSSRGRGHAYGHPAAIRYGRATPATGKPHPRSGSPASHGQPTVGRRSPGRPNRHARATAQGGPSVTTGKPHPAPGPPPTVGQPSAKPGRGNAKPRARLRRCAQPRNEMGHAARASA